MTPRQKTDNRPKKGFWAPGKYIRTCKICNEDFIGDKRAYNCADCAYQSYQKYTWTVTISGKGITEDDAWEDAINSFALDPGIPPEPEKEK